MGKLEEARRILEELGLPKAQQNDRSARTFLALLGLREDMPWDKATNNSLRIHDIIEFIKINYGFEYKENSRESIRRQTIHQFEHAGIIERNRNNPERPTNSGLTDYSVTKETLILLKKYKTDQWIPLLKEYLLKNSTLIEKYKRKKGSYVIPVIINNKSTNFSVGSHNLLQKSIIEMFVPKFASGAEILYIGDTANKSVHVEIEKLEELGIPLTQHDKLPDVILYIEDKNWIYLIEAVTTHGPISNKRMYELEEILENCKCGKIYVNTFLDFKTFKKYINDIAWETEVWLSSEPDHMIHLNGDRFVGPR
jgi:type II restriction enzyme